MQFTFKSKFLFTLAILTNIVLPAEGKIDKPKTLYHSKYKDCRDLVTQVIFSDSKIITFSAFMAKLWNRNGNLLQTIQYKKSITYANLSHDGNIIATASDNTVTLQGWNGAQLATLKHNDRINYIVFNNNSTMVATASNDRTVKIWTLNGTLCSTLQHEKAVQHVTFSHNSTMIATISETGDWDFGTVKVWTAGGKLLHTHKLSGTDNSKRYSLTFSHDDSMIGASQIYGKIWNQNGKLLLDIPGTRRAFSIDSVVFSQDNTMIATSSNPHAIDLCSLDGNLIRTLKHDQSRFKLFLQNLYSLFRYGELAHLDCSWGYHVAFSHDNTMIATTIISESGDGTVRIWDKNGNLLHTLQHGSRIKNNLVYSVFFSDDNRLATASDDGTVKIWDLKKK